MQQTLNQDDKLRTWPIRDAAKVLNISERHLANLIAGEKVHSIKFGRRRLLTDATLRKLATQGV